MGRHCLRIHTRTTLRSWRYARSANRTLPADWRTVAGEAACVIGTHSVVTATVLTVPKARHDLTLQGYEMIVQSRWYTDHSRVRREEYGGLQQETGRERYYRQVREIREELGISHNDARERWSDYYAPGGEPVKPLKALTLSIRASTANQRTCPFCRDAIYHPDEGGPDFICTACNAHYHLDCFEEELGGRCATLGCSTRRVISRARTRIRARGREVRPLTPETPVTTARPNTATVQELDPEDYRRAQREREAAQRAAQEAPEEPQEEETTWDPRLSQPSLWEAFWGSSAFAESIRRDGPVLLLVGVGILVVLAICWLIALGIAG